LQNDCYSKRGEEPVKSESGIKKKSGPKYTEEREHFREGKVSKKLGKSRREPRQEICAGRVGMPDKGQNDKRTEKGIIRQTLRTSVEKENLGGSHWQGSERRLHQDGGQRSLVINRGKTQWGE